MEIKHRTSDALTSGFLVTSAGTLNFSKSNSISSQRTLSHDTMFPTIRRALKDPAIRGTGAEWIFTHRDYGSSFITEKSTVDSSIDGEFGVDASKGNILPNYQAYSSGPVFLGWNSLIGLHTDSELSNDQQLLWTMGARAVKAARPNKPKLDLPVLVGELRKDGLPTIIGSLMRRSRTARDVFRQGGKEYLNVQFGWAPLVGDLVKLLELIPESRARIEQFEREIGRLVRRRFHFPDTTEVSSALSYAPSSSQYMIQSSTPLGAIPQDHFSFSRDGAFAPSQVTRTTTKTWFSGGFRFYHRDRKSVV